MVFSYRLDDAPIENRNFCPRDRCSFRGWRKREKTTRFSRGWQLQLSFMRCFFFSFFFLSSGLLYDKSQRDEWATLDWSERSRPLRNSGSFAARRTEIRRMEKLRGQGGRRWKRSKGMDRRRTRMVRRKLLPDSP